MANFYSCFLRAAERWPDNVVIELQRQSGPSERHTYGELRRMAESVTAWLQRSSVPPGTRCAVLGSNSPRWVAAYLGALASGCVAVPLDTAFKPEQIRKLLADSGASILFCDAHHLPQARTAVEGMDVKLVLLDDELQLHSAGQRLQGLRPRETGPPADARLDDMLTRGPAGARLVEVADADVAVILYTSGTTSDPKGVMLTHANLHSEMDSVFGFVQIGPEDAILGVLPLFHALAQMANLLLPFAAGARVIYLEALNTTELLRALAERDITVFACVPQFFYLIHERIVREVEARGASVGKSLFRSVLSVCHVCRAVGWNVGRLLFRRVHRTMGPRMRYLITGGSRFDPEVARDLHALGFDILQAYGLTETSGGATCTPPRANVLGSVGRALPGVDVRIDKPEPQPEGPPVGEICIRGGIVMKGYYHREEATAEVLRDGWLYSGDLGHLDAHGNLHITGRRKDVIVLSSGKNIYPEEIEAHYVKSPFIKEICVLGLQGAPGQPFAERLHAVVVPDFDALKARKIVNVGEAIRFDLETLSAQLPSTKRILSYDIWQSELPRTTTRKLKRFAIQQEVVRRHASGARDDAAAAAARQFSEADLEWLEQPEISRALDVIRQASKAKKGGIHPDDSLELDLGLDSMERVELLVALEEALDAKVPDSVASEVYSVRDVVEAVRASAGATRGEAQGWDALLAASPDEEDVRAFEKKHTLAAIFFFLLGRLVQLAARDLFQLRVSGIEKLPRDGPLILCPNHQSFLDPPVFLSILPWHVLSRSFSVGTSEIFGVGPLRRMAKSVRLFPVDPDRHLVPAMRIGAYGLRKGLALILYPEGERTIDGSPKRFKKGAAILATHLNVPIYPVAMDGFFDAWPRGKGFQGFARLQVAILDPVLPAGTNGDEERQYSEVMGEVRARIVRAWEEMHGRKRSPARAAAD